MVMGMRGEGVPVGEGSGWRVAVEVEPLLVRTGLAALLRQVGITPVLDEPAPSELTRSAQNQDVSAAIVDIASARRDFGAQIPVAGFLQSPNRTLLEQGRESGIEVFICLQCGVRDVGAAMAALREGRRHVCSCCCSALVHESLFSVPPCDDPVLSPRESEVLALVVQDYPTREIADTLFISEKTVRSHRSRLMEKLCVDTPAGLVVEALQRGLLRLPERGPGGNS